MAGNVPHINETSITRITQAVRDLFAGRSNAVGSMTCTANQATTAVTAINCGAGSKVFLFPAHANAAAELGAGTCYVSAVANGTFTVTHANAATANRTFYWVCLG